MFFLMFFLPKSPRWLALKGKIKQAEKTLYKLHPSSYIEKEINEIKTSTNEHHENLITLLRKKPYISVLLLAMGLQVIQQFSGMNAMLYFAPEIFSHAGFGSHTSQMWATLSIGLVNVIATVFSMALIEIIGRRALLYISGGLIFLSTTTLAIIFISINNNNPYISSLALCAVFTFIIGYALGFAPVVWTLCSEIFPLNGRSLGMCFATTTNWVASGFVGVITLPLISDFGIGGFYVLLACFAVISLLFIRLIVPETKGLSLEKISENLFNNKKLRNIGQ